MSGMFKGPKQPKPQPVTPAPTIDEAQQRRIEQDRLKRRRGRMSTILSREGTGASGGVGVARLLGGAA